MHACDMIFDIVAKNGESKGIEGNRREITKLTNSYVHVQKFIV